MINNSFAVEMNAQRHKETLCKTVKTYLKSHHMLAYDNWLEGFVDYVIELSIEDVQAECVSQWLLNDLRKICPGSLPTNLETSQVLQGKYMVQINGAIDISTPAYQQYLKLKKTDTGNIEVTMNPEEKISSKRMLKLEMTDGRQDVTGIEYETITSLPNDVVPGCKILITGPVLCRRGVLLLTDASVYLRDGEVDDLYVSHSLGAQLAAKLHLPPTEDAQPEAPSLAIADNVATASTSHNNDARGDERSGRNDQSCHRTASDGDARDAELPAEHVGKRQLDTDTTRSGSTEKRMRVDDVDDYPNDNDFDELMHFDNEDDEHLRSVEIQFEENLNEVTRDTAQRATRTLAADPYVYIKQINELPETKKTGKAFKVKAQILKVLTNLTLTDKWNLKCTITDGTGCMDVEFASDILSGFLRFTPQDIKVHRSNVASNPDIKKEINLAYKATAKSLQTLYCIMELTMCDPPVITRLIDFDDSQAVLLKERFNASDLSQD